VLAMILGVKRSAIKRAPSLVTSFYDVDHPEKPECRF
jgi:hypothetical protein